MKHPHVPAFICCALVVLLATVPLAAQPVVDTLRSQTVRVDISGLVATTTVEQVWAHFGDSDAQATFQFRLPSAAVVTDLALWVDGLRCPGEIYPRSAARAIYRQIVDRKRDPALMEYVGDGVWQLQVFPISPKSSVKVDFTYTQLLTPLDGWVVYDSLVTPDANEAAEAIKAGELSFQATIRAPGGVTDVKSATHKLGVQRLADGAMVVGVRKENADLAKGLQMSFKPGKALPATIILSDRDRSAFVGSLKAPKELLDLPARKINAILVLDASLSMAAALTDARAAIVAALDQLGEGDTFNIVVMSSDVAVWRDKPQPADAKNKQDALAYLGKVSAGGGTDLPAGLRAAAAQASDPKARYELMVFTDGQDTVAATVATACPATMPASHPSTNPADNAPPANCRIFGLGSYDCSSLTTLAEWTGGAVVDNFKPPTAAEIVKLARRPAVTDAHCAAVNAKELGLRNVVLGEMTRGECLVAGQFDKEGQGEFVVSARIDGNAVELRQSLPLARDGGGWVDARGWGLWIFLDATQKLRDIHAGKAPAGDLMAIIEASRKYHVLTPATSLLVLENDQAYIDRVMKEGAEKAGAIAKVTIAEVKQKMGLL